CKGAFAGSDHRPYSAPPDNPAHRTNRGTATEITYRALMHPRGLTHWNMKSCQCQFNKLQQNVRPTLAAVPPVSTERQRGAFSQMTALQPPFPVTSNNTYILYRARKDNRDVILRMLKETANGREKQEFLGFAAFVSGLGPHHFLPELLGAVSVQPPLMMAK
ncbi:hypothetical protein KUCAC02_011481, partial [Chaenocephalus aceratus]